MVVSDCQGGIFYREHESIRNDMDVRGLSVGLKIGCPGG